MEFQFRRAEFCISYVHKAATISSLALATFWQGRLSCRGLWNPHPINFLSS